MRPWTKIAEEAFKVNDPDWEVCGPMIVGFVTNEASFPYLSFNENTVSLNLDPAEATEPTSFENARMFFSRYNFTLEVPIKADIITC